MAGTVQEIGVLTAKDDDGTVHEMYPVTKIEAVEGLNNALAVKVNTTDIVDNLESTSTILPLSANQGNVLKKAITGDGDMTLYEMVKEIYDNRNNNNNPSGLKIPQISLSGGASGSGGASHMSQEVRVTASGNGNSHVIFDTKELSTIAIGSATSTVSYTLTDLDGKTTTGTIPTSGGSIDVSNYIQIDIYISWQKDASTSGVGGYYPSTSVSGNVTIHDITLS